jgi:N-acetylglucosamine-6-phosphate deacetylase
MTKNNTPVFITHTKANVAQTQKAISAGASHGTHFYDVFYQPDETDPGVRPCGAVEAILADDEATVDFILDGQHVDPAAVKMALKCKGPDKVSLITDANIGAGNKPGTYKFGSEEVSFEYPGAPARGTEKSNYPNALYGSGLTMNTAVKNAVEMLNISLPLAVKMASQNPARVLKLHDTGTIDKAKRADIVLMDDEFNITRTWINGNCCYKG